MSPDLSLPKKNLAPALEKPALAVPLPDDAAPVRVTATFPLRHLCPFKDEVDDGTVTVGWTAAGATFELHELAGQLNGWADVKISHEALTDVVFRELRAAAARARATDVNGTTVRSITVDTVTTHWTTAGGEVVVEAGTGR